MSDAKRDRLDRLIMFWFGDNRPDGRYDDRKIWWLKDPAFDRVLCDHFLPDHEAAAAGEYDTCCDRALHALAVVICLDQLPRNIFRNSPRMYATDHLALAHAQAAVAAGLDQQVPATCRTFFYTPFEHAEDLAVQERSVALYNAMRGTDPEVTRIVRRHHEIVARFGRFPHRNDILGRETTPEELALLKEPDSAF
ncbi:MAG: DUF924 domain-containing protein [Proteobacteria bacterium]|nr:DUF924 domain-containing protein [Pseudomonadota bacterium]